jgi:hypothetical protein
VGKNLKGNPQLMQIVLAFDAFDARLTLIQHRQHQGGEEANDGDDTKQFYQRERTRSATGPVGIHAQKRISIGHAMVFSA